MFGAFEPEPARPGAGPVLLTVGECSPPSRYAAVRAVAGLLDVLYAVVPGGRHAVHLDVPAAFAALIAQHSPYRDDPCPLTTDH